MATVRARRLGRELRQYRENAELTIIEAAKRLGWDRTKIGRLEGAQVGKPKPGEITELLDLYGVPSPKRDALLQLARDARRRGWWTAFGDVFDGTFPGLEDEASDFWSWENQVVPGLLQTDAYAWAVLSAADQTGDPEQVHRRVQARMARRPLLNRPDNPPRFHSVLDEAVLRRQVGGPDVMEAQLAGLLAMTRQPNIKIQVLPFEAGAHAGVDGSFVILGFPNDADPDVVFVDLLAGGIYPESEQTVRRHRLAFKRLTEAALSPDESAGLIADLNQRSGVIS
jgi:transcriptional regulator with XRE-family HTH domain